MALWKRLLGGVALVAVTAGASAYWRINRSGPALVSANPAIKLVEKACPKSFAPARCGVVIAPLDYTNPAGKSIEISFIHYPAVGFGNHPTFQTIIGGPGNSLEGEVGGTVTPLRLIFYNRPILLIDPRGTGRSSPILCDAYRQPKLIPLDFSLMQPCADQIGSDIEYYTTENTARDFDRVRQALGINELDLYGMSYGSNLAAVYASRFPNHIRTLGLDGAYPLKTFDAFPQSYHETMVRQFKRFCEQNSTCKTDELMSALTWAVTELRKAPRPLNIPVNDGRVYYKPLQLNAELLAGLAVDFPRKDYDEKSSKPMWHLPFIASLLKAYQQKDWGDMEQLALNRLSFTKKQVTLLAPGIPLFAAIACRDDLVPWKRTSNIDQRRLEYKANAAAYDAQHPGAFAPFTAAEWGMRKGGIALGMNTALIGCRVQKTPLPAQPDLTYTWPASLPVLVLNGDHDIQTPNMEAGRAAMQFKSAQFARFKHHGHGILAESICAAMLVSEFIDKRRVADPMKCLEADPANLSLQRETVK
jgi:pimeloyl-ACP methyl ester carboxylesterase